MANQWKLTVRTGNKHITGRRTREKTTTLGCGTYNELVKEMWQAFNLIADNMGASRLVDRRHGGKVLAGVWNSGTMLSAVCYRIERV